MEAKQRYESVMISRRDFGLFRTHLDLETLLRRKLSRTPSSLKDSTEGSTEGRKGREGEVSRRSRVEGREETRRKIQLTRKEEL